ncbi:site-specific integrase [Luteimonas sp. MJ246]|uniref:tyrosine-type recombinase/integrase n=1 Tax=Luteimonas sp. MJ174 TaxID=3129237 RepID=UPI0031B9C705
MRSVAAANRFLRYFLLARGRVGSHKSWATIGQHIYDYFAFLEAFELDWKLPNLVGEAGAIAVYRDYCTGPCSLSPRTVNQRLSTVARFYTYAVSAGLLTESASTDRFNISNKLDVFPRGSPAQGRRSPLRELLVPTYREDPKFLSLTQVRDLVRSVQNPTHKLMIRLALQAGLRREEIATFPEVYVRKPDASSHFKIRLDPRDGSGMRTKGARPRTIYVSAGLMVALWYYRIHTRPTLSGQSCSDGGPLFLTGRGLPWADDGRGFHAVLAAIGKKLGIKLWPHLLRHTYATHTLAALQRSGTSLNPLLFLQKQLGHSSIATTMTYVHLVDEAVDAAVTAYDVEVGEWSRCLA